MQISFLLSNSTLFLGGILDFELSECYFGLLFELTGDFLRLLGVFIETGSDATDDGVQHGLALDHMSFLDHLPRFVQHLPIALQQTRPFELVTGFLVFGFGLHSC